MIFTFYSYKGGVGRSMALANVAELLYQEGNKVLIVDWDLEAPGLERFFPIKLDNILAKPGVIDMLLEYKKKMSEEITPGKEESLFPNLDEYLVNLYPETSGSGQIWLLPAGKRFGESFVQYANNVRTFNWQDFYQSWEGELYFEKMRQQFEQKADFVLIDSRTGVTEMGGVCAYQFADVMVMFCTPNQQNLAGTLEMATSLKRSDVTEFRKNRPLELLIVPARVEDRAEKELLDAFRDTFTKNFNRFVPESSNIDFWNLKIPHVPFYSFNESVIARETGKTHSEDMLEAFRTLAQTMTRLSFSMSGREYTPEVKRLKSVLIVDSDATWRQRLKNILVNDFYVELAGDYQDAAQKIETQIPPFDVVVTEINLSETNNVDDSGVRLVDNIRKTSRDTQTIIVTRFATVSVTRSAFQKGVYDLFEKAPDVKEKEFTERFGKAVHDAAAKANIKDVFVAMPFSPIYTSFYEAVIKKSFEEMGLKCRRADDFFSTNMIIDDIHKDIRDSRFVLADLSDNNANVLFEVGIAHATGKSVILLTRNDNDIPWILSTLRFVAYENSLRGVEQLRLALQRAEKSLQRDNYPSIFPKVAFTPAPTNTCMVIASNTETGKDLVKRIIEPVASKLDIDLIITQDIFASKEILNKVWENMNRARFVIADLSELDSNVFYMAGLAYGLKKKTLLLTQESKNIPFDLRTSSYLQYSMNNEAKRTNTRNELAKAIKENLSR